jgi:hypothetical protein
MKKINNPIVRGWIEHFGFLIESDESSLIRKTRARSSEIGAFAPRRRLAVLHAVHNSPLGWEPACTLHSQRNKLFSGSLSRRRET